MRKRTSEALPDAGSPKLFRDFIAGFLTNNLSPYGKDPTCGRIIFQLVKLLVMALL